MNTLNKMKNMEIKSLQKNEWHWVDKEMKIPLFLWKFEVKPKIDIVNLVLLWDYL